MWKRETLIVAPRFQVPDRGATKHIIIYGGFSPAGAAVGLELAATAAVVPKKEPSVLSTYPQKADKKFLKVTDVTSLSYIYIYHFVTPHFSITFRGPTISQHHATTTRNVAGARPEAFLLTDHLRDRLSLAELANLTPKI